jgi:hypothetical protein
LFFHQAAAALPFSCSSFWSATLPAWWGNSVLNAFLCPRDWLWDPPPALFWEAGLLPHPTLSLCAFPDHCWVLAALLGGSLVTLLLFSWAGSVFTLASTVSVSLQLTIYVFQFCWGRGVVSLHRGCPGLFSQGVGRELHMVHEITSSFSSFMQAALKLAGREKWLSFFQCRAV